jgi:hypothetical protein
MDVKINIPYDFSKTNIYVLKLQEDKYYIGKTYKLISERYIEHCKGHGSAWTRRFQPIEVIEEYNDVNEFEEDKITKIYMAKYGIDNVRGGAYCRMKMPNTLLKLLKREIWHAQHKCLECGSDKHFVAKCKLFVEERKINWYLVLGACFLIIYGINTYNQYIIGNGIKRIM